MSKKVTITIDGREIEAHEGEKVLWVALDNSIFIPNLCALKEKEHPSGSCRLCYVQVEGRPEPVTACTLAAKEGLSVQTRSPQVDRLVKSAFELLLSNHRLGCGRCPRRKSCALLKIARERGLKMRLSRLSALELDVEIDESPETFAFDRSRCLLCGRCVWICQEVARVGALGFTNRGITRRVGTFREVSLAQSPCTECGLCVEACPSGALYFKEKSDDK
ncbi:MAG TPA: 4Fe-4S dicluster domain-containing protein [Firmicutes bacterium]|jgi:bidirectional [NiFe] hydrogenase diaphorase subunit|nr:4Fe-4S dicluster domain-containing protein [Bacillota bacterium]